LEQGACRSPDAAKCGKSRWNKLGIRSHLDHRAQISRPGSGRPRSTYLFVPRCRSCARARCLWFLRSDGALGFWFDHRLRPGPCLLALFRISRSPLGLPLLVLHPEGGRPKRLRAAGRRLRLGPCTQRAYAHTDVLLRMATWKPMRHATLSLRCRSRQSSFAHLGLLCQPSRRWNAQRLLRAYYCYYLLVATLNSHSLEDLMCRNYVVESFHDEIWIEKVVFA
jgi:hypothetical protein